MADGIDEMFDEDEQDRPVAFEQDADDDEAGNGYFIYPDGSRKYASDYDEAMRLNREGKAKGIDVTSQNAPEPEPVTPIGLEPPPEEEESPGLAQPAREAPSTLMQQAPPAKPLPLASQSRQVQMQDQQSQTQTGGSSSSVQRTGSAVPREEFERGRTNIQEAYANQIQDQQVRDMDTQDFYAKRRAQLMQEAADAEAKVAAAQAQNLQRQQIAQQKYQEIAARKEDPFEGDGGIIGTIMAGIAVYLGGISSGMLGGPNQAMEAVQENRRAAVEAQRDQKNSMLRQLEKELGSLEAAVPALEAKMNRAAAMRTEAFLADEKSLEMRQKGQQFIGALRTEAAMKDQEALKNFYGNMAQSQAQQSGTTSTVGTSTATSEGENRARPAATAGVSGADMLKKAFELDKIAEERGATPEERARLYKMAGVPMPSGRTAPQIAQGKQSDAEKKRGNITNGLVTMHKQLDNLPDEVFTPSTSNVAVRAGRSVTDFWLGDGTADKMFLSPEERKQSQAFTQAYNSYLSMLSVANEQGAMANDEAKRAIEASGAINSPRLLQEAIENTLEIIRAHEASDEPPQQSGDKPPSSWKGGQ